MKKKNRPRKIPNRVTFLSAIVFAFNRKQPVVVFRFKNNSELEMDLLPAFARDFREYVFSWRKLSGVLTCPRWRR